MGSHASVENMMGGEAAVPRGSWFNIALRTEMAWLAAAGTTAPLSARPPSRDESLCSLLPLHPMLADATCRSEWDLRLLQHGRGGKHVTSSAKLFIFFSEEGESERYVARSLGFLLGG